MMSKIVRFVDIRVFSMLNLIAHLSYVDFFTVRIRSIKIANANLRVERALVDFQKQPSCGVSVFSDPCKDKNIPLQNFLKECSQNNSTSDRVCNIFLGFDPFPLIIHFLLC